MEEERKYCAFISYRHKDLDKSVAKKIHSMIERYTLPSELRGGWGSKKLGKVFRDEEELPAAVDDPVRYYDEVIFPDKVRLNRLYLHHRTLWMDLRLLWATVFGRKMEFEGETI